MRTRFLWLILLATVLSPLSGRACEPIFPLVQLLGGATLAGPALITRSLAWLLAAVAVKGIAFVFLEARLPWAKALLFMLLANVLSTIPGMLIAISAGSIGGVIFAVPLIGVLGLLVGRRLKALAAPGQRPKISGATAAAAFVGFFILSMLLFGLAWNALEGRNYAGYWALKFAFVTLVACTGIVISAVLEEYAIAQLTRKSCSHLSFYTSVFRANYITLGAILLVVALQTLPKRLAAPHFIISALHVISSFLGIT